MMLSLRLLSTASVLGLLLFPDSRLEAADWPNWRGPERNGISTESDLPESWSLEGENLAWRVPYGGRSGPVVMGDRVFLQNSVGEGETLQERVMCFDAASGELLWEHRFNVYLSDVPTHRVGWASPTADPREANLYVFGVGAHLLALTADGEILWERPLGEEFGMITTHGGRTVSPVVEGDLVIVSGLTAGWGDQAIGRHRFYAFDKKSGDLVWVSSPGQRPYDTTYSYPTVELLNGTPVLLAGGGDGAVHALKLGTGEPVWRYEMSKRGINTSPVLHGTTVFVSHSEENLDTSVMGMIAAVDAGGKGELGEDHTLWRVTGFTGGFSSPVLDGDRLYQLDNGANLVAWDLETGDRRWTLNLGTIQRASPVLADGKLYVGTENGRFFILRPDRDGCEILSEIRMGDESDPEPILGSAAISRGRVYVATRDALYAIGPESLGPASPSSSAPDLLEADGSRPPAHLLVVPGELLLEPGESVSLSVRLFDDRGRFLGEQPADGWTLHDLEGTIGEDGTFVPSSAAGAQAGRIEAEIDGVRGHARARVIPSLPWSFAFEDLPPGGPPSHWVNAPGKYEIREMEDTQVLVKLADNPFTRRARTFLGLPHWSDYTISADVRAEQRRRQMGDAGVVAQRYALILFGNHQRLELQPWQPETERTVRVPFEWEPDTWYRLKLRVENLDGGRVRALGKAWPAGEPEPEEWLIERIDPVPNRVGSPGIYADATFEVFFDNLEVRPNR